MAVGGAPPSAMVMDAYVLEAARIWVALHRAEVEGSRNPWTLTEPGNFALVAECGLARALREAGIDR